MVYVKEIIFPDVPIKEYKRVQDDVCVAFISDLHVGSKMFAKEEELMQKYGNTPLLRKDVV